MDKIYFALVTSAILCTCIFFQESEGMNYVFGYTVAHDVSARDWQLHRNGGQFLIGKSMDCFCPLGPAIVAKEDLKGKCSLNA